MPEDELNEIVQLVIEQLKKETENIENSSEYMELLLNKETKTIRIFKSVSVMLDTYCKGKLLSPSQYATKAIAESLLKDIKK